MSTDQPAPHWAFNAQWIFWYAVLCWAFFAMDSPREALAALAVLAYFFVPEILALEVNWRWTLSATMTWVVRKMSKHTRPFRGWNWLLVPAAVIPSMVMLRIGWTLGGWWGAVFAWFPAVSSAALCHQHWLDPSTHG